MSSPAPLVVANLKANLSWEQVDAWLDEVAPECVNFKGTVVFCPSHPFLAAAYQKISQNSYNLKIGAQDISKFEPGAYTGEIAASQIADMVEYAIIGHSERRQNFAEDEKILQSKVKNALNSEIEPIFCVQSEQTQIPDKVEIVAYEPVFAIGTGNPDTPQNVENIVQKLKAKGQYTVLYGGSVSANNVKSYINESNIDGVLIGATNSVAPQNFTQILKALK